MQNAVDTLTRCRVTLKWSYVMAFYLAQGNTKEIFEDLQARVSVCRKVSSSDFFFGIFSNLEQAVEDLSQMLEEPIEEDTVKSLRQRMTDKAVSVTTIELQHHFDLSKR
jgi:ariadne-1